MISAFNGLSTVFLKLCTRESFYKMCLLCGLPYASQDAQQHPWLSLLRR